MTTGDQFRAGKRLWSAADDDKMRREYPDRPTAELARELRRALSAVYGRAVKLGLEKSEAYRASPHACRLRRGDNVGAQFRFKKGQVPPNKGLRRPGWAPGRMRETQFKKGERSGVAVKLWKPIGTERISKDGYLERKVNNDLPLQARWRAKGHAIVFRNGDKRDIRLENLECITRRALMARNTVHNLPAPLKQTIHLIGAVRRQIRRRTNASEKQDQRPA